MVLFMDMNRAFFAKRTEKKPQWRVLDAQGQTVGRFATKVADILRGKDRPTYTPHADAGDYVIIINAEKAVFTGNKMTNKLYTWYTGYIGGQKTASAADLMRKKPEEILRHAIVGMLPKNALSMQLERKLKIYVGPEHPHQAQVSTT
jgi:large subunit ribosomal protein L13